MALSLDPREGRTIDVLVQIGQALWCSHGEDSALDILRDLEVSFPCISAAEASRRLRENEAILAANGHYFPGTIYYGLEHFWGIDRIHYLERRLLRAGLGRDESLSPTFDRQSSYFMDSEPTRCGSDDALFPAVSIKVYWSFRSPYSQLCLERLYKLARHYGVAVDVKVVLPMVMRGYSVPLTKRLYIITDCAREAEGQCFGKVADPVGEPTKRAMCVLPFAEAQGKTEAFLKAWAECVWGLGYNAGSASGMRAIAARAKISWSGAIDDAIARDATCERYYCDPQQSSGQLRRTVSQLPIAAQAAAQWRQQVETNRQELAELGLWGVPSFAVIRVVEGRQVVVGTAWGNDRLWLVERHLRTALA